MNREEEIELITKMIEHPAGFDIGLMGLMEIRSHSDGYEVSWPGGYKEFTDLQKAAKFFVDKRREMELGLDIEAQLMKDSTNE